MAIRYNPETINALLGLIDQADLRYYRPRCRHEPGDVLDLQVEGVFPAVAGRVQLRIEAFAGSGFAGQVYRTTLLGFSPAALAATGLRTGATYAIKIHTPPSRRSQRFRNAIYWLGYQGAFPAQVNENAARAGALWQKLIRRGARSRFGEESCVVDVHATFFDPALASFGEINEWVPGRVWRLEIDRELFRRRRNSSKKSRSSREYLAKKRFMANFVALLHDMGAHELARQYEWWTAKSQPNVLKRLDSDTGPAAGLTALDFRPGLALLFFLPLSPIDFKLILRGLKRGALVQFDRPELDQLRDFCLQNQEEFAELAPVLDELAEVEALYRNSLPDITRHRLRLLTDGSLRRDVKNGLIAGWKGLGLIDAAHAQSLQTSPLAFCLFYLSGALPVLGKKLRRLWGRPDYGEHLWTALGSTGYLRRVLRARQAECLINWHRKGRVGEAGVDFFLRHPLLFAALRIFPGLLPLPAKMHRALIDWRYAMEKVKAAVVFPIRFYRNAEFRLEWLNNEIDEGMRQGMIQAEEKERILSQISDPLMQKYMKCFAVHFCTFPITRVAMLAVGVYAYFNFGNTWQESMAYALAAALVIGVILPISPGSLIRGLYVVYLMIRERNFRNYWLAAAVSFWRFIGYLGVPLQMVKEFPPLARLIASRWVTKVAGIVPVFGESGALLEHMVFDLCVNFPLSIKNRFKKQETETKPKPATDVGLYKN